MNEMMLTQGQQTQNFSADFSQKTARYMDAKAASKKALRDELAKVTAKFLENGGKVVEVPGFKNVTHKEHSVLNNDAENAGFTKVARVIRWVNEDLRLMRRKQLSIHAGIGKNRIYAITASNPHERCAMSNAEYKKIATAMEIIERRELKDIQDAAGAVA